MNESQIFDEESEMAVLGSCLEDNSNIPQVFRILDTEMFYSKAHQIIFDAIETVYTEEKTGDIMLVAKQIKDNDDVNRIGGLPYLYDILEKTVDKSNADVYASIVKENYTRRRLVKIGQEYKNMAYEADKNIVDVVNEATESLTELTVKPTKDTYIPRVMNDTFKALREAQKKLENGEEVEVMETGFPEFDLNQTATQRGTMLTITANSGAGKSILVRNIVLNRFLDDFKTLMFTTEVSNKMTAISFYSMMTGIKFRVLQNALMAQKDALLSDEQWSEIKNVHSHVDELEGWVESGNVTVEYIKNRARELKMEKGLDCLVVDYVQNIYAARRFQSRPLEIDYIVNQLAGIAEELDVHIIVVSQLSMKDRKFKSKDDPLSGEGSWSAGIRNNSSCLFQLRSTMLDPRNAQDSGHKSDIGTQEILEMCVLKDRYAESPTSYGVVFEKPCHRIRKMSQAERDYFHRQWLDLDV